MGGLTPMHCAVIEKQRKKNAKRKAIALREGTLLPEEQADALDDAAAETIEVVKRAKKRMAETEKQQSSVRPLYLVMFCVACPSSWNRMRHRVA